jgi:hypothetical protein
MAGCFRILSDAASVQTAGLIPHIKRANGCFGYPIGNFPLVENSTRKTLSYLGESE